jgi:hypothetical protein
MPPLLEPVSAVHTTIVALLVVEGTSIDTTVRLVGSVSMVAPAVLTSEYYPVPLALVALTCALIRLSLGSSVRLRSTSIGTLHARLATTLGRDPSQLVNSCTMLPLLVMKRIS